MSKYRKHLKRLLYILVFTISLFGSFEYFLPIINNPLKLISNVLFNVINLYLFTPLVSLQENLPISLEIAIWLAPLCTVLGIFSILEKIFVSTKHNLRHKNKKHHLVIGLNNFSYRFINNVLNDDDFFIYIDSPLLFKPLDIFRSAGEGEFMFDRGAGNNPLARGRGVER